MAVRADRLLSQCWITHTGSMGGGFKLNSGVRKRIHPHGTPVMPVLCCTLFAHCSLKPENRRCFHILYVYFPPGIVRSPGSTISGIRNQAIRFNSKHKSSFVAAQRIWPIVFMSNGFCLKMRNGLMRCGGEFRFIIAGCPEQA